jgi:hypothetical protein
LQTSSTKRVGVGGAYQPSIQRDERYGLLTHNVATGKRFVIRSDEKLTAFLELELRTKSQFQRFLTMTVIEIRPHRWGWKAFEAPGVEPVLPTKEDAIGYAQTRARFRTGEIRVLDATGKVERVIGFDEANRKL